MPTWRRTTRRLAFIANEGQIARIYEEWAAGQPDRREEYQSTAEKARESARRSREVLRSFRLLTSVLD
jgi:hypothetical protein